MTSGVFHSISIAEINANRDRRQRRDLLDIDVLADSIRRLGLIHPIVVTRELELVAGERRLSACKMLGWITIPVQYVDEIDQATHHAIELEENIKRQDISWQDEVRAVRAYHDFRLRDEPKWTHDDTADAIGLKRPTISRYLQIADELAAGNLQVAQAPKLTVARGIVERALERRDQQALDAIHRPQKTVTERPKSILTADFTQWVGSPGVIPRFNFIHCDFPYGIEADDFDQGAAAAHGGYTDTQEHWQSLMEALAIATASLTTPSAHLMFWFAMRKEDRRLYEPTAFRLERMGWDINPLPLIWVKSDNTGILPDPSRGPRQVYETCFLGSRGDRKIVRAYANAYASPTVHSRHMSEKPEAMLRHFFRMLVDENTVMLDPTCGSGSALRAAESLGAPYVLGLEINEGFAELARQALDRARDERKELAELAEETINGG